MQNSSFTIEVDQVDVLQWSAWLDQFDDANLYQTWAYGEVRWGRKNLSHIVLKKKGDVVAMAQLRIIRPTRLKCGIAYMRWGPLCHRKRNELDGEIVRAMAQALHSEYVGKRGLFLRILPNAFLETPRAAAFQSAFSQFQSEPFGDGDTYRTIVVDLDSPLEVLRKNLDQKWRNQLNRAEKNELKVFEGDGPDAFRTFIQMYDELWARKKFSKSSDIVEFQKMHQSLPEGRRLRVLVCEHEGVPAAGVVGTAFGDTGIYLFGATSDQGMKSKGSYLLQWTMIKWLKENGIRYYNLGGINPEKNPGVYHFKEGFSGQDVLYMPPLVACENILSKTFVKIGTLAKGGVRQRITKLLWRGS